MLKSLRNTEAQEAQNVDNYIVGQALVILGVNENGRGKVERAKHSDFVHNLTFIYEHDTDRNRRYFGYWDGKFYVLDNAEIPTVTKHPDNFNDFTFLLKALDYLKKCGYFG